MRREFIEPEVEVVEFELAEVVADDGDEYIDTESGWIIDPENPWN